MSTLGLATTALGSADALQSFVRINFTAVMSVAVALTLTAVAVVAWLLSRKVRCPPLPFDDKAALSRSLYVLQGGKGFVRAALAGWDNAEQFDDDPIPNLPLFAVRRNGRYLLHANMAKEQHPVAREAHELVLVFAVNTSGDPYRKLYPDADLARAGLADGTYKWLSLEAIGDEEVAAGGGGVRARAFRVQDAFQDPTSRAGVGPKRLERLTVYAATSIA